MNNMKQCAKLQGLPIEEYMGKYNSSLFLTEDGFTYSSESFKFEEFATLEENQTIKGGVV